MSKSVCTHINHEHPALIVPCPACGEEWKYQIVHPSVLQTLHENISALERALQEIANVDISVPMEQWPQHYYADLLRTHRDMASELLSTPSEEQESGDE